MEESINQTLEELLEDSKKGDQKAFRAVFDTLSNRLFTYALTHTKSRDEALDIVQETFIDLWSALPKFKYKNEESFYGFVFLILKRKLYKHYKKNIKSVEFDEKYVEENYEIDVEDYRYLEKNISSLPKKYQELLKLRYWSALSFKEISILMDVKEGTAKVWHHRAIRTLRNGISNMQIEQ